MSKEVKFNGQVFNRGLLINKQGIQHANRIASDFQAQPKITEFDDLTKRSQVELVFSTKPKDAFLLKNHVDPRTVDSKYDNWIFDIDDKSLPVYLAVLCPHAELVFEKIKPSEELNDLIKDSLESNNPYEKLMDLFKSHGYFLYEKVIFGYKLSKICYLIAKNGQESYTKYINFNDFTTRNDILNEWENLIRPYFDVSYLTLINGNTVKKDNLQEWVLNLKSDGPLQVIDLKLFPLYQILDRSLQDEIEFILGVDDQTKMFKVKERVLITGTVSINASTNYYRVRFPETLKSSNYKIFGKLLSQNNPINSAVIKFQSTSISGFSVIIENFNIAGDSQIIWILTGLPSEIGYYSRDTRKIRLLSSNDNPFKYEESLSIPLEVPKNLPAGSIICTNIIYPPSDSKSKIIPSVQNNHDKIEINISIDGEKERHYDNNNNEYSQKYNYNEEYLLQWCIISLPKNQIRIIPYLDTIGQPIDIVFKKEPKMSNTKENTASSEITNDFNQLNFIKCQELVDMNDPKGMYWLGYCYEYGIGVESDENKAFTFYQKSADMNDSNGMYQVGYCYYLGIGVEIDKHKAFTYYLKSAEAGNSMGIRKTAICYKYGIGVEKSDRKFDEWIKK
ncbi:hypothetical protein C2G38_1120588 [Gigaspora rosea]|uniref:HCP-like protein n=1 Tax=Gigaspora rosea TaxID=44941 RepID=A0A397TRG0_9GLOM|nr:hypothetical protein C2G38_1120588 [Gigaspora rosea]